MIRRFVLAVFTFTLWCSSLSSVQAETPAGAFSITHQLNIGGEGRWDYLAVDPASHRLYVPRSTYTQIIDADAGTTIGTIVNTPGVHGVALALDLNRGFTSNGKANTVTIFDLKTLAVLGTVPTGNNPDSILYEPNTKRVFSFNGKSGDVTVIDAATAQPNASSVVATIAVGGKLETLASD